MEKKYRAVIFDWDGTLMDSTPKIVSCMQTTAKRAGMAIPHADAVNDIIGISLRPAIARLFQLDCELTTESLVSMYREEYLFNDKTPSPLFDGSLELLKELSGADMTLAVATGKARAGLDRAFLETNTGHYFTTSRCADETRSKPHPLMLHEIMAELNVPVSECVMIGDTEHDLGMAKSIEMPSIGVTYGAQPREKLVPHQPQAIVNDISDLAELLLA